MNTEAPTLSELRKLARNKSVKSSIQQLVAKNDSSSSGHHTDCILVTRKPSFEKSRDSEKRLNAEYAQQFHRNCFSQFRVLEETRESFFGLPALPEQPSALSPPVVVAVAEAEAEQQ